MLSDLSHQISKDYGVYLDEAGHTLRGLFIIDGRGILRQITMNDLPVGRSVDETLRLVQAFQYTDKHGEVCPAGWKPGSDTVSCVIHYYVIFKHYHVNNKFHCNRFSDCIKHRSICKDNFFYNYSSMGVKSRNY